MSEEQGEDLPDDVPTIKEHLRVRREAMSLIAGEIQLLLFSLKEKVGNVEYLRYLSEIAAEDAELRKLYEREVAAGGDKQAEQG